MNAPIHKYLLATTSLAMVAAVLFACVIDDHLTTSTGEVQSTATIDLIPTERQSRTTQNLQEVLSISGWFSIIWNDQAHYFITDDEGHTTEVLIDELLIKPLGGPLALDRTRVTIVGVIASDTPTILQAQSITREIGE